MLGSICTTPVLKGLNRNYQSNEYAKDDCPKLAYIFDRKDVLIRHLCQDLPFTY